LSSFARFVFLAGVTVLAIYILVKLILDPGVDGVLWSIYGFVVLVAFGYFAILIGDWFVTRVLGKGRQSLPR
jgi:uncharacterized membrane protein